jgi:glutamine synthetase type III
MPRENLRFLFFCAALLRAVDASPADISLDAELEDMLGALARGEDTREFALKGKGFQIRGPLANDVFVEAIDEISDSVDAWTEAGERYDVAVREVVADSYRRHRAATMLQPAFS